jgi:predicted dehydrogenase
MRILVFGAGSIGRRHVANLVTIGQKKLTVADPNPKALAAVKGMFDFVETSTDPDKPFEAGRFDVVLVCSPPQFHLPQLSQAVEHGAHVLIEKPFALSCDGVEPVLRRAEAKKLCVMTAFNMRYLELIQTMRKWLDQGRIGKVLGCRVGISSYMPAWHPAEDYRRSYMAFRKTGGGALFDCVHGVDLAQWLAGEITAVSCLLKTTSLETETDDVATLSCATRTGLTSLYFDYVDRRPRKSLELIGSEGTMIWEYSTEERLRLYRDAKEHTRVVIKDNYAQSYVDELREFFRCIESGEKPLSDGWNGLSTQRVLDMAMESSRTGRVVKR